MTLIIEIIPFVLILLTVLLANNRIKDHFNYRGRMKSVDHSVSLLAARISEVSSKVERYDTTISGIKSRVANLAVKAGISND